MFRTSKKITRKKKSRGLTPKIKFMSFQTLQKSLQKKT